MNTVKMLGIHFSVCLSFLSILTACHKEDVETISKPGTIPVTLSTAVSKIQTRVNDSSFGDGDEIGVFLLEQPNTLLNKRHADNVRFVCDGANWIPDEPIFFPAGDSRSNFVAYYPYEASGIAAGKSSLTCKVKADQSTQLSYSLSDFLVAAVNDVEPKEDAVMLNFKHKLTALEIIIDPGNAYTSAQELLEAFPVILIKNVCTSAEYDFLSGVVSLATNQSDLVPGGEFRIKDNKLVGKRAVVVPQTIPAGKILITLSVEGRIFNFTLGEEYTYLSGTKETYTLTLVASVPEDIPGNISTSVSAWENENTHMGDIVEDKEKNENLSDYYSVFIPDFSESSVYKAMDGNVQIAEICQEYLKATGIENQSIVIYPVKKGKVDHTKGTVLQVLDASKGKPLATSVHGGTVSWNTQSNALTYTKGISKPMTVVYVDKEGNISDQLEGRSLAVTTLTPDVLKDSRENLIYPIVKIGMQYWMRENLRTVAWTDGSTIALKENNTDWKTATNAYCHYQGSNELLYKNGAISEKIAPEGWKVPTINEWNQLISYVASNSILLVDESWNIIDSKSNLTGFCAPKIGLRSSDGSYYDKMQGFWHSEGGYAYISNNTVNLYSDETTCGCSLRCIRKEVGEN